ncbi:unnamed protein product [Schistosoma margrebowiei]|uniref:Uncharacterized protein n=1 Tax=Schistosoma margrebowiei TaxID=48269 RepID=A0A183LTZ8_9TREM|nr:unnamed protein product [Schistosoma margrebowiei]
MKKSWDDMEWETETKMEKYLQIYVHLSNCSIIFAQTFTHKVAWISSEHITEEQIYQMCIDKNFRNTTEEVRTRSGADVGFRSSPGGSITQPSFEILNTQRIQDSFQQQVQSFKGCNEARRIYYGGLLEKYQCSINLNVSRGFGFEKTSSYEMCHDINSGQNQVKR